MTTKRKLLYAENSMKKWTKSEKRDLVEYYDIGYSLEYIAQKLGRSVTKGMV